MEHIKRRSNWWMKPLLQSAKWALDNWGEDVLALQFDGGLFYWDTSDGLTSLATTTVSGAPTKSRFMIVSGDDRHVICLGTETTIGTTLHKIICLYVGLIKNQLMIGHRLLQTQRSFRLTDGNQIKLLLDQGCCYDMDRYSLILRCSLLVHLTFVSNKLVPTCGAVGINAAVDVSGNSYWMSNDSFFVYDGAVKKYHAQCKTMYLMILTKMHNKMYFVRLTQTTMKLCGSMHLQL